MHRGLGRFADLSPQSDQQLSRLDAVCASRAKLADYPTAHRSFQPKPLLMPTVRAAAQYCNLSQPGRSQFGCGARGSTIGLANDDDGLSKRGEFHRPTGHIRERHVERTRKMAWRRRELFRLPHVDQQQAIAPGKSSPQLRGFNPPGLRHTGPAEQTGQEPDHD
jgi:hypothetical protein